MLLSLELFHSQKINFLTRRIPPYIRQTLQQEQSRQSTFSIIFLWLYILKIIIQKGIILKWGTSFLDSDLFMDNEWTKKNVDHLLV